MAQRFPLTLTQLSYFAACAKALNMTAASQELHVAQSAVSTAVAQLERSLGATLFIRQHSKGLILTAAGESLLRDTQRLFGMLSETIDTIQADRDDLTGQITIASFHTLTPFLIPPLLHRLRERHPNLAVSVREGDYEQNLADLRGGRAEVAITYALSNADGVAQEVVGHAAPHAVLSTDHPLASRASVSLAELSSEPFVLLDLPDSNDYFLSLLATAGVSPEVRYRTKNYEAVRSFVAMGLGFSILNQRPRTAATYAGNSIATVELSGDVRGLDVTIATLAQVEQTARSKAVKQALVDLLAEDGATATE
ncbi:HTH-type transcriptional regulator HdfR [Leucobacter aridicollis]|uniref:DNA-binding transcriptional LysR family regulator n=1 Tax=Leucobacter aridicollis TaxID=283878 RepID=A0A852RF57_9MICO|nr:LysR substrate-binding domain-containing protein [Leucobacter aridicollis]MBL3681000.1 LysR family transcriptional regulator [Leucobacter aridicollis]NYD27996.1 DNA-binding transcriptional LysR family regulator [Leucobacter aridicollis]